MKTASSEARRSRGLQRQSRTNDEAGDQASKEIEKALPAVQVKTKSRCYGRSVLPRLNINFSSSLRFMLSTDGLPGNRKTQDNECLWMHVLSYKRTTRNRGPSPTPVMYQITDAQKAVTNVSNW